MKDLIERLEKLDGPCRECDADIAIAIQDVKSLRGTDVQGWFWANFNEWRSDTGGRVYTVDNGKSGVWFESRKLTESIDAALSLIPDGWIFEIANDRAEIAPAGRPYYEDAEDNGGVTVWHKKTAIAICIASIKARQSLLIDGER